MQNRLRKDPSDATALYNLASLETTAGNTTAARTLYQQALAQTHATPENAARTLTALGALLESAGDPEKARAQYQAALTRDPANPDARFNLAQLDLRAQRYTSAEQNFRTLLLTNPKDSTAHLRLAQSLLATEKTADTQAEARHELDTALTLDPNSFDALFTLATLHLDEAHPAQAIPLLETALKQKDDPEAHQLLAVAYAQSDRLTDAVTQLTLLAALSPKDPEPHRALAQLYSQLGRLPEALREQTTVTNANPTNPDDWNDLGVLHARAGNTPAARQAFNKSLTLNPQHEAARKNLSHL